MNCGEGVDLNNKQEYISNNEFSHISKLNLLMQHTYIFIVHHENTPPLPSSPHTPRYVFLWKWSTSSHLPNKNPIYFLSSFFKQKKIIIANRKCMQIFCKFLINVFKNKQKEQKKSCEKKYFNFVISAMHSSNARTQRDTYILVWKANLNRDYSN